MNNDHWVIDPAPSRGHLLLHHIHLPQHPGDLILEYSFFFNLHLLNLHLPYHLYLVHLLQHPGDLILEYMLAADDEDTLLINILKEDQILATAK